MSEPTTRYGRHLYELLPQVMRSRDLDHDGQLLALLDAIGGELDRLRGTLDQRLAEVAPGATHPVHHLHPDDPLRRPQEWLLPYMAELLDVRLTAPGAAGRQQEVQRAVRWRRGKGTLHVAGDAAEQMLLEDRDDPPGRTVRREAELLEGRALVAVTPRVDLTLLPESSFRLDPELPVDGSWQAHPLAVASHPGVPSVTPDVRSPGRAVIANPHHPRARFRTLPATGEEVVWRHLEPRAAPCFPWSHEDDVVRTVDTRTPARRAGWHHPKTVVALVAPPLGFFDPGDPEPAGVDDPATAIPALPLHEFPDLELTAAAPADPAGPLRDVTLDSLLVEAGELVAEDVHVRGPVVLTADAAHVLRSVNAVGIEATAGSVELDGARVAADILLRGDGHHRLRGLQSGSLAVTAGRVEVDHAWIDGPITITAPGTHHLVDVVQRGDARVVLGPGVTLEAHRCALGRVEAAGPGDAAVDRGELRAWPVRPAPVDDTDVLLAVDCLLDEVEAAARVTLDRCTVLTAVTADVLRTADAVVPEPVLTGDPAASCLRHTAVPVVPADVAAHRTTADAPVFWPRLDCSAWGATDPAVWGEPGCGVLHNLCPTSVSQGAEDGGELGAYHHRHHVQSLVAVVDKLSDLLPVGITAIAVPDVRLHTTPPIQEPAQ